MADLKESNVKLKNSVIFGVLFLSFFLFRLIFGLASEFWFADERQIYLLGLKFFTTGLWPYFGPDVVYTGSQIPGALQSLLVGAPLHILSVPEAPFIFLNLLSFSALILLGWYCSKQVQEIPKWFIFIWVFTAPWLINYSTHVVNPSYVLFASIIFFVGIFELSPPLSKNIISPKLAMFMIGFSTLWIFQIHMSWVLLGPYILLVFIQQMKKDKRLFFKMIPFFILGLISTGIFLLPTFIKYGLFQGSGGTAANVQFKFKNLFNIFKIIVRFFAFSSFELSRFIGPNTVKRLAFLKEYFWAVPFLAFAALTGVAQVIFMIVKLFKKESEKKWKFYKLFVIGTITMLYVSFFFSIKGPSSHTFYLLIPVSVLFFFYTFKKFFLNKKWRIFAAIFLVCGIITHCAVGIRNFKAISLYKNRAVAVEAIQEKDYKILGTRRKTKSGIGY